MVGASRPLPIGFVVPATVALLGGAAPRLHE